MNWIYFTLLDAYLSWRYWTNIFLDLFFRMYLWNRSYWWFSISIVCEENQQQSQRTTQEVTISHLKPKLLIWETSWSIPKFLAALSLLGLSLNFSQWTNFKNVSTYLNIFSVSFLDQVFKCCILIFPLVIKSDIFLKGWSYKKEV